MSADVSERQALSNLIRCSSSRDPIIKHDSLPTLMSRIDVGASLAGLSHCRDVLLFPIISCWERSENRLNRLLSCVGMFKLKEWFLLFLATMASSHAEDRRLRMAERCVYKLVYASLRAMRGPTKITLSASADGGIGWTPFDTHFFPKPLSADRRPYFAELRIIARLGVCRE